MHQMRRNRDVRALTRQLWEMLPPDMRPTARTMHRHWRRTRAQAMQMLGAELLQDAIFDISTTKEGGL